MEKKEIIILGAIGNTARQNRDDMRVLDRRGCIYSLKAHIDKDHPLIIKESGKYGNLEKH